CSRTFPGVGPTVWSRRVPPSPLKKGGHRNRLILHRAAVARPQGPYRIRQGDHLLLRWPSVPPGPDPPASVAPSNSHTSPTFRVRVSSPDGPPLPPTGGLAFAEGAG